MKIESSKYGIAIIPETYFEQCYLQSFLNYDRDVILKHSPNGLSAEDVIALEVRKKEKKK